MCMTPEAYEGSALKGGSTPWGISNHTTSPPVFPSTIMGDTYHNNLILVCATRVLSPPKVMSSPSAAWRVVCGCHCRWGDVQCHALSTQTTQDSPSAEPRRSRRN